MIKLEYDKTYLIAFHNKVTGKKTHTIQGFIKSGEGFKHDVSDFYTSIRVYITHKNRLGWKMNDVSYSIAEFNEENRNKVIAWEAGITLQELLENKKEDNEDWI